MNRLTSDQILLGENLELLDRRRERRAQQAPLAGQARHDPRCLDCFAGSGTLGAVAAQLGRRYVLIDSNPQAVAITRARLGEPGSRVGAQASDNTGE